jgi:BASS family bile acid:Na+ symporter
VSITSLIGIAVKLSIALTVFGLGLRTNREEATSLFRSPGLLFRSLLSMNVIMPLIAVVLAMTFDLNPAVKLALIALSVSPVPPILPGKQLKHGGSSTYAFGLLVAAAVLAIVLIPFSIAIIGKVFGRTVDVPSGAIAVVVLTTVLAPLAVGILVRRTAPGFANRIAKPVGVVATVLLVAGILPVLFVSMPAIMSLIGNGTLLAIIVFVLAGLAAGHLLGGPEAENRTVLALSTASRHPGVAIAIAHITFPELKPAVSAILLYLLVSALVTKPYLSWWSRRHPEGIDIPSVKARHA